MGVIRSRCTLFSASSSTTSNSGCEMITWEPLRLGLPYTTRRTPQATTFSTQCALNQRQTRGVLRACALSSSSTASNIFWRPRSRRSVTFLTVPHTQTGCSLSPRGNRSNRVRSSYRRGKWQSRSSTVCSSQRASWRLRCGGSQSRSLRAVCRFTGPHLSARRRRGKFFGTATGGPAFPEGIPRPPGRGK